MAPNASPHTANAMIDGTTPGAMPSTTRATTASAHRHEHRPVGAARERRAREHQSERARHAVDEQQRSDGARLQPDDVGHEGRHVGEHGVLAEHRGGGDAAHEQHGAERDVAAAEPGGGGAGLGGHLRQEPPHGERADEREPGDDREDGPPAEGLAEHGRRGHAGDERERAAAEGHRDGAADLALRHEP